MSTDEQPSLHELYPKWKPGQTLDEAIAEVRWVAQIQRYALLPPCLFSVLAVMLVSGDESIEALMALHMSLVIVIGLFAAAHSWLQKSVPGSWRHNLFCSRRLWYRALVEERDRLAAVTKGESGQNPLSGHEA